MELTLEDYMRDKLSKEMSASIDFDIICDTLVPFGWTIVEVKYTPSQRWDDVMLWADINFTDDYQEHKGKWLIKDTKDATIFKLKFS
jgi:hypothetical protein